MNRRVGFIVLCALWISGCVVTKVVTVPMRVIGAAASVVPVVGETVDDVMDGAASTIDKLPL